jgi:hypothetical protein
MARKLAAAAMASTRIPGEEPRSAHIEVLSEKSGVPPECADSWDVRRATDLIEQAGTRALDHLQIAANCRNASTETRRCGGEAMAGDAEQRSDEMWIAPARAARILAGEGTAARSPSAARQAFALVLEV